MIRSSRTLALLALSLGALGTLLACRMDVRRGLTVYLAAFGFLASTAFGGLLLAMVMHACAARWFVALRRLAEAIAGSALVIPVLFLPIALGLRFIYPWAGAQRAGLGVATLESLAHARGWMSARPFLLRACAYLLVWLGFAESLRGASLAEDHGRSPRAGHVLRVASAAGLPVLAIVGSLAVFDGWMSLTPGFTSSVLGLRVLVGGFTSALGVLAVALHVARARGALPAQVGAAHAHAVGRLLLTGTCLWAYLAVSELIIVWSANLPREAPFYLARWRAAPRVLSLLLIFGHFLAPFLLLLARAPKRSPRFVAWLGGWLCLMHALDSYWLVVPAVSSSCQPLDLAPFLLLAGAAVGVGYFRFARAAPLPLRAPSLASSIAYEVP